MTPAEENVLRIRIEKLEKENAEMKKLSSIEGFYDEYFKGLKEVKFNHESFNKVNEKYFGLFGKYRYADYDSFKRMSNYYNNQNKTK